MGSTGKYPLLGEKDVTSVSRLSVETVYLLMSGTVSLALVRKRGSLAELLLFISECVAVYNYTGEAGDLCFSEGDVIKVYKDEGEWWEGSCRGEQGLFPANYVKKRETEVLMKLALNLFGRESVWQTRSNTEHDVKLVCARVSVSKDAQMRGGRRSTGSEKE